MARREAPVIDEHWAGFIESGVSIVLASRTAEDAPVLVRALGCRVSRDRRTVTLLVSAPQARPVLDAIRATGAIAAVFSRASTHVSLQIKAADGRETALEGGDQAVFESYRSAFIADAAPLGYPEDLMRALLWCDPADLAAVRFTPASAFIQTPGPRAGEPLGGRGG